MGETVVGEVAYVFDGEPRFVYNVITPMWINREIKGIVGINIDITERVLAEKTLRASEEKFRTLFELLPIGVTLLDEAGVLLDVNPALTKMLQISKEDALTTDYRQHYIQLDGLPLPFDQIPGRQAITEQRVIENVQLGLAKSNHEAVWVTIIAAPLPPQHGLGAVVVTNDVTNFKLTAERLQESQTRWQSVVNTMTDGVIVMDGQGVMQSFNPAAEQIFGYSAAEAIGEYVNMLMPEPARSHHQLYLAHYYQTKTAKVVGHGREVIGQRKDGSLFPLELAVNEFQVKGQSMFTGVVRDITERKKAEADLQVAHARLAQAYDETLLGWALALELRDEGTSGHSLRVADLTVRLAQALGVSEADLVHFRRGALLHDIGKMAIPDSILLKPGPLTPEERLVMQQHPVYAYEMLKPITYLAPALDIPHYHHETWDGSGYPAGLKEQAIPLAARIFAVVDVWDALISDRPYRRAWPKDKALSHIYQRAGISFDPQVIEAFMRII
jgi:PAS domain S-box-containing protein/putative nucleotidyltransferase with HDIG domain